MTVFVGASGIEPESSSHPLSFGRPFRRDRSPSLQWRALVWAALLGASAAAWAETGLTALGAVKLLPKGASGKIAIIAAQEGKPSPERWYILVHDAADENGLHEYVVANGEVVASRSTSQFAEELKGEDVIGAEAIKIDSDKAAKVVERYAEENKLPVEGFNFELKKGGKDAAPIWHVTGLNPKGEQIGQIVLTATKGTVLSHDGFKQAPPEPAAEPERRASSGEGEERKRSEEEKRHAEERAEEEKKRAEIKKAPRAVAVAVATPKPNPLQRMGGGLKNLFGGGNRQ